MYKLSIAVLLAILGLASAPSTFARPGFPDKKIECNLDQEETLYLLVQTQGAFTTVEGVYKDLLNPYEEEFFMIGSLTTQTDSKGIKTYQLETSRFSISINDKEELVGFDGYSFYQDDCMISNP